MTYFLISDSESGRSIDNFADMYELNKHLADLLVGWENPEPIVFVTELPRWSAMDRHTFYLIKGEVVSPTAVDRVTAWEDK